MSISELSDCVCSCWEIITLPWPHSPCKNLLSIREPSPKREYYSHYCCSKESEVLVTSSSFLSFRCISTKYVKSLKSESHVRGQLQGSVNHACFPRERMWSESSGCPLYGKLCVWHLVCWPMPSVPALRWQRQLALHEFEACFRNQVPGQPGLVHR